MRYHIPLLACLFFISFSCTKVDQRPASAVNNTTPTQPDPPIAIPCTNRPVLDVRLEKVGELSVGRVNMFSAVVGKKMMFAGGWTPGTYSSRVDIFDGNTGVWSTSELTIAERQQMAVATVGSKVLFAGGSDNDMGSATARVDIYDDAEGKWSVAELSKKRTGLTASVVGDKVYFIGGGDWENALLASNVIDIYDAKTNQWSSIRMPNPRMQHTSTVIGSKIYIAGGTLGWWTNLHFLHTIDVYDTENSTWSTLPDLRDRRVDHAAVSAGNLVFWAGGIQNLGDFLQEIEIRDLTSGQASFVCMSPKIVFSAVQTEEHIIFFPGTELLSPANRILEIYHKPSGKWYTGLLEKSISQAAVVVMDNQVYVAGGSGPGGEFHKDVWRLIF